MANLQVGLHARRPLVAPQLLSKHVIIGKHSGQRIALKMPQMRNSLPAKGIITRAGPSDVFVLDYDGVIADSQHEVSSAGLLAAEQQWPSIFPNLTDATRNELLAAIAAARPRLVKGYESMMMARLIHENPANLNKILNGTPDWDAPGGLLQRSLDAWEEDDHVLAEKFERLRAGRVAADAAEWVALSPLYSGVGDALADCPAPFYICSSKRGDRLLRLLNAQLNLQLDESSPRVLSSLIPPNEKKIEALRGIMARPVAAEPSTSLHFIDDRFETIKAVSQEPDLAKRYNLYLASWGYNTDAERAEASEIPGIRIITLPQFCELLRFGIIMGVDDGCQDTEEEATAAVYKPFIT